MWFVARNGQIHGVVTVRLRYGTPDKRDATVELEAVINPNGSPALKEREPEKREMADVSRYEVSASP